MKAKLKLFSIVGLMAGSLACFGQDATPPVQAETPAPAAAAATLVAAEPVAAPVATPAPEVATPAVAATPATPTVRALDTATSAAAPVAEAEHNPDEVIPLIVIDDLELTAAIKNLARQANLNYLMDPKVPYGGVGASGVPNPDPKISLRWEKLTAQQALSALLGNYSLVIVDDPKTSISRITVKDPAAAVPLVTRAIQLRFTSPSNMVPIVQAALEDKRSRVLSDMRSSQLIVVVTENELTVVSNLVVSLDTPTKQVLIEARLIETSKSPETLRGIDWSGTLQGQNFSGGNNTYSPPATISDNKLVTTSVPRMLFDTAKGFNPATAFLDADGVSAVLSFLNKDGESQVISTPRAVTLDNEEANLSVTRAEPIFKNSAGTQGSPGGSEVTYTNLGTILKVTPRISANEFVQLHVVPEVSSLGPTRTKLVVGTVNQADIFDIRRIETRVLIPSGNTLVLGGLISDDRAKNFTKVPLMGDVPLIGRAFRSSSSTQTKKNLIIFITPTIVKDDDFSPTPSDYLKNKPQEIPDEEVSAYRSAKPYDWSKRSMPK